MNWLRNWYRHHYKTHYRTPHMARMVSWQATACGVRTVVTNCTHGDCEGWIVLQREAR